MTEGTKLDDETIQEKKEKGWTGRRILQYQATAEKMADEIQCG